MAAAAQAIRQVAFGRAAPREAAPSTRPSPPEDSATAGFSLAGSLTACSGPRSSQCWHCSSSRSRPDACVAMASLHKTDHPMRTEYFRANQTPVLERRDWVKECAPHGFGTCTTARDTVPTKQPISGYVCPNSKNNTPGKNRFQ